MKPKNFSTSQQIKHIFMCSGQKVHVFPGTELLRVGKFECPDCGAPVHDITDTALGKAYFAFARPDLGKQS
jgi:predicted RNA-binding Zn-ribbon protein involved in translation (DUF1610 family)